MITKGYVISKSQNTPNKYLVRIPIFESAGQSNINQAISECTLSHNPGTYEALIPGDCVFISFEDNLYSKPVILGKLFVNVESESSGYQYNTDLKVTHKATLPVDTTIGSVPFDNILNYFNSINESIDRLSIANDFANIVLYPTTVSSDISGYFKMVTNLADPSYNTTPVDIPTGVITTDNQLLASLATDVNVLTGNPGIINVTTIGNIKRTVGNNNQYAAFYFKIFKRDSLGVETEIAISNETPNVIIGNIYEEFRASALLNNGIFVNTDRIVIKYYARLTGNTGSNYDFQFGGSNPVRTLFPVPTGSIPIPTAFNITTNTTNFNGILSADDNTVQKALNTLDDHGHPISGITNLQTSLDGKAPTSHTHAIGDVTNLQTSLDAKLPLAGGTMTGVITTPNGTHGIIVGDDSRLADRNIANTLFVEGVQNNDRGYVNFSSTTGNALGAIAGGDLTWKGSKVWTADNDGSSSGLDADTLDGIHASGLSKLGSGSDFADGTLVVTSLDAAAENGPSWTIEVTGKGYGQTPFNFIAEGYNYANTFINLAGYNYGSQNITYLKVLNYSGNLAFWWPRFGYWNSFDVKVTDTSTSGIRPNRVSSIINSTEPASAKKLQIDLVQNVNSSNISSYPLVIDKGGSQIGTSTNWDSFNTPGMYGVASGSVFTGTGAPPSDIYTYGHLLVTAVGGQGIQQTYYPHTGNAVYFRTGWNGGGWYGWQRLITSANIGSQIPNAGTTTVGGIKTRLSGTTLFITDNGNNP
jgi:hypothetical protein